MRVLIRLWESQTESSDEEELNESSTNNDVADLGEITENHMETENGKESMDCPAVDFGTSVGIKIETSDSCENSLDGYSSLVNRNGDFGVDGVFSVPNCASAAIRYSPYDAEMIPVCPTTTASAVTNPASNSFDQSSSFLDNANEQPMFEPKHERTDLMENPPFFNSSNSKSDTFVAKGLSQQQQQSRNDCEIVIDSSSDSEQSEQKDSASTPIADAKDPSPGSNSSLEFSALTESIDAEKASQHADFHVDHQMMEVNDLEDVQQFLKLTETPKTISSSMKTEDANAFAASLLPELEGRTLMSPSISITPVTPTMLANAQGSSNQNVQSILSSICLDLRPNIDVSLAPFSTSSSSSSGSSSTSTLSASTLPPSLTITPINIKDDDRIKDRGSSGNNIISSKGQKAKGGDDKVRIEKKKKRKHDESGPMGPPEKIPAKADQLCRPVPMTIKQAEIIIPRSPSPSGAAARKFAASPTPPIPLSLMGKVSPNSSIAGTGGNSGSGGAVCGNNVGSNVTGSNNAKSLGKSSALSGASPSLSGSPKMASSNVSPKHGLTTSSPKNVSSGSSGKPSMSALKQVVVSPSSSSKNSNNNNNEPKSKSSHKDLSSRDYKEKKNSSNGGSGSSISGSGHQSPKPKSSSAKFGKADTSAPSSLLSPQYDAGVLSSTMETKLASSIKAKKGGLMAVVDRLNQISKSEDGCNNGSIKAVGGNGSSSSSSLGKDIKVLTGVSLSDVKGQSATKGSNEYMIKHHNDGIKMTINRTRAARDSLVSNKSGSVKDSGAPGSDSPKHKASMSGNSGISSSAGIISSISSSSSSQTKKTVSTSKSSPVSGTSSTNKVGSSSSGSKHSSKSSSSVYKSKSNHSTKSSHSSESSGSRKEKLRPSKTHSSSTSSDKSIFSGTPKRSSPSTMDVGGDGVDKQYKAPYQPTSTIPKTLANYQIPKISDRNKIPGGGENEMKKSSADGSSSVEGAAKDPKVTAAGDSMSSPLKAFTGGLEERGILTEAAKNLNTYESSKPKQMGGGNENSLESVSGVTSQHQMTANCSVASVQSADSIKMNL